METTKKITPTHPGWSSWFKITLKKIIKSTVVTFN